MKHIFKRSISQKIAYLFIALGALTFISSCKKDSGYDFDGSVSAYVQLVNTSTDAGAANLYVASVLRTPNTVTYGAVSGYNQSYVGPQDVNAQSPTGAVFATTNLSIDAANYYTFFLTGTSGGYAIIPVHDDTEAAASGKAKVRFVQASSSLSSASISANGVSLFTGQAFKSVSSYSEVAAGAYVFTVANAGSSTVLATSASATLKAGGIYTVYTTGLIATTDTNALAINVLSVGK